MNIDRTYGNDELIARLEQKDHYALKYLYDKYAAALYSVILQIVNVKEIADEVVSETFRIIWRTVDSYDPEKERLFTWILKIARLAAIGEAKTKFYHQPPHELAGNNYRNLPQPAHMEVDDCGLKKMIYQLKEEEKTLIELCYFKDFTDNQIAQTLGIPQELVRTKIKLALSELRIMLS